MNNRQIEDLKTMVSRHVKQGSRISIPEYGISGRIVGVGFKPYWTNTYDSKIDKMELNILNENGRIKPFTFNYIIGYEKVKDDGLKDMPAKRDCMDIHVYSVSKLRGSGPFDKVRIEFETC